MHPTKPAENRSGVRRLLLRGVFYRILVIEGILLAWSLLYRLFTQDSTTDELFWYAGRIVFLVGVIIAFMMVTLRSFLDRRIITPLEAIATANRQFREGHSDDDHMPPPPDSPREIREIVSTRNQMLSDILKVSRERLQLVAFIRETFGRYLSSKIVDQILESPAGSQIGGRRETVTILFSDLRGFTAMTETMDPERLTGLLNRYLECMSEVILRYDGVIDELMGDAILTVFGVPENRPDDAERAVACGIEMQRALTAFNRQVVAEGYPRLEMGIGINTGSVIVGNIGSPKRLKYGIIGSAVNIAARIESNTIGGQILIGESTFAQVRHLVTADPPQTVMMKGLKQPLVYYPTRAMAAPYSVAHDPPQNDSRRARLNLPFTCWPVGGKDKKVADRSMAGETVTINTDSFRAVVEGTLEPLTDLKLRLDFCAEAHCFADIYAKVVAVEANHSAPVYRIHFTSINPADRAMIESWVAEAG